MLERIWCAAVERNISDRPEFGLLRVVSLTITTPLGRARPRATDEPSQAPLGVGIVLSSARSPPLSLVGPQFLLQVEFSTSLEANPHEG
jgi:hypothetical protein